MPDAFRFHGFDARYLGEGVYMLRCLTAGTEFLMTRNHVILREKSGGVSVRPAEVFYRTHELVSPRLFVYRAARRGREKPAENQPDLPGLAET